MIFSFIWLSRYRHGAVCAALVALSLAFGCARSGDGDAPAAARTRATDAAGAEMRARAAEVLGALKLVRQEYANAVPSEGGTVMDPTEYSETELFAEQAEAKFTAFAERVTPAERREAIRSGLARIRTDVARKAPVAEVAGHATTTIAVVEELLAGAVPEQIRGAVLATERTDRAIAAEEIVGEYRIGLTAGPPRQVFRRDGHALVPAPAPPAGAAYVAAIVRERRTKRFLPAQTVTIEIAGADGARRAKLEELWGDFHQYGTNLVLPPDGPVTVTVHASPPAYARHGDMLTHFVAPVSATLQAHVRSGALAFDARPVAPTDADYAVGDDVLQATAEAGSLLEAGPYRVGVIVEGPEPIWTWKDGRPALQPAAGDATNHVEVVLLDRESGQLVPDAHVTLTFLADGREAGTAMLHPLLSIFSHYGATIALPRDATAVRVHVEAPALGSLDRPRLAGGAQVEMPLPARRGGNAA